jgi:ParB family chromosome partitioning protein
MATAKITLRASRDPFNKLVLNVLFAHCAALSINAVHERGTATPNGLPMPTLARAVNLDMAAASWRPTVDNYLGRIPKARVLKAP